MTILDRFEGYYCYSYSRYQVLYYLFHSQQNCDGAPIAVVAVANVETGQVLGSWVELRRRTELGFRQVYLFLLPQILEERIENPHLQK